MARIWSGVVPQQPPAMFRVADDRYVAEGGDFLHQRQESVGPERTIHAEGRQRIMPHGGVERLQRLPRQRSPALVAHAYRHDDGESFLHRLHRIQRCLHVQRVERRFDEQQVHAALDESLDLLAVARRHLIETVRPFCRPGNVRCQRQGLGSRTDAARHPYFPGDLVGRSAGEPGPGESHLPRMGL